MIEILFHWLDIFTSEHFKGNPAAVCIMDTNLEDSLYQKIAKELGLSETAFTEKIKKMNSNLDVFPRNRNALMWTRNNGNSTHIFFTNILCKNPKTYFQEIMNILLYQTYDNYKP